MTNAVCDRVCRTKSCAAASASLPIYPPANAENAVRSVHPNFLQSITLPTNTKQFSLCPPTIEFCGRQISIAKETMFAPSARVLQCQTQRGYEVCQLQPLRSPAPDTATSEPPHELCGQQISIAKEMLFAPSARVLLMQNSKRVRGMSAATVTLPCAYT